MSKEKTKKLRVIITGASGMVGEGVLLECLAHDRVGEVLVLGRRTCGVIHPRLKERLHGNFHDITKVEKDLAGYDACFFCLGASSIGMSETDYYSLTYTLTMHVAGVLSRLNPAMTFIYVSGAGTDGSEKGRTMWARVKGKTENDLMKLPFRSVYAFRPGFMKPTKDQRHAHGYYRAFNPLYPLARRLFPRWVCTLSEVGIAMINAVILGYEKNVLDVPDIIALSKKGDSPANPPSM